MDGAGVSQGGVAGLAQGGYGDRIRRARKHRGRRGDCEVSGGAGDGIDLAREVAIAGVQQHSQVIDRVSVIRSDDIGPAVAA